MTTLDAISRDRMANRRYWNSQVRYVIGHIRDTQDGQQLARLHHWLGSELERRRWYKYLEAK